MGSEAFPGGLRAMIRREYLEGQDGLSIGPEQHQIGLPVSWGLPVIRLLGAFCKKLKNRLGSLSYDCRPRFDLPRGRY